MTAELRTDLPAGSGEVRVLQPRDEGGLRSLMASAPARHCFAEARLDAGGLRSTAAGGPFWGFVRDGRVTSALLVGANLVPMATDATARRAFARHAIQQGRRSSSIVGAADEVLDLWRLLEPAWGPAREVRPDQLLMAACEPAVVPADREVRCSTAADADTVFPACVAMFTEEVGVSPVIGGMGAAYRRRVEELIGTGRSFARFDAEGPVFKAELGAVSRRACQIQGVWVRPEQRGLGLASRGMAAVVEQARRHAPLVTLYVNSYNRSAVVAYSKAGFRTVDRFATILF